MMNQTGNDMQPTIEAWSEVTMKVLFQRMDVLGFGNETEHLRNSLQKGLLCTTDLGNDRYSMGMNFNLYGRFVDMGVGDVSRNTVSLEIDPDTGGLRTVRRLKEWFSGY